VSRGGAHGKAAGNVKHGGVEAKSKKSEGNQVLPASPSLGKNGCWEFLVVTKHWRRRRGCALYRGRDQVGLEDGTQVAEWWVAGGGGDARTARGRGRRRRVGLRYLKFNINSRSDPTKIRSKSLVPELQKFRKAMSVLSFRKLIKIAMNRLKIQETSSR
jgi:hypothetical protein